MSKIKFRRAVHGHGYVVFRLSPYIKTVKL